MSDAVSAAEPLLKGCCIGCGQCCYPITANWFPSQCSGEDADAKENRAFTTEHWHRISQRRAEKRASEIRGRPIKFRVGQMFWECDQYDVKTRRCMAQDTKPPVCRNYPHYPNQTRQTDVFWTLGGYENTALRSCGYWLDVPLNYVPKEVDVPLLRALVRLKQSEGRT